VRFVLGCEWLARVTHQVWASRASCRKDEGAPDDRDGAQQQPVLWTDPTERLALALGLAVTQLAHYTRQEVLNPDTAVQQARVNWQEHAPPHLCTMTK